ncbi:acetyl-CoA carboxylase biotin carboxylase subunit [Rhodococcus sp. Eu-32]|uniref:acetyl-CoA carboxylase biotin carboxylase subunit n=1 Tax=Rhodococcus sp. Eu-32 TaxID=1017319 RepID=UPI000DF35797|nr:acetyl-CoA carboxylase biotin carboxylase subunit [Rhodococcus sp. Eu-32]RRQ25619.1 acetyl-CoA carboxylase biotin carboxylase subunit [Rhodococcus sp. Eu-32]
MRRVLIANRGEIAVRIVRACFDEGIESVLAVSECDKNSLAAQLADRVVVIGPGSASDSYLSVDRIVAAALYADCDAVHPGYGFLSERTDLVEACAEHSITFIGPPAEVMRRSGDKLTARRTAADLGIPTGSGTAGLQTTDDAIAAADELDDYPLLLKASAGGGGRGMTVIRDREDVRKHFARSSTEAQRAFGDGTIYLERYVEFARHVEVQILADAHGHVVHLGERDCSTQRRYQKLVEEAPAVGLPQDLLDRVRNAAVNLAKGLDYVGAGTVEFLVDTERNDFVFLEVNARVQVEHPVTEMVTSIDIVREQLRVARGESLSFAQDEVVLSGHAIECRINAEDAQNNFLPHPGRITGWVAPQGTGIRVDTYAFPGAEIPPFYDSMIAKLIVHAPSREEATVLMGRALSKLSVEGVPTTIPLHSALMADKEFQHSPVTTKWLENVFLPNWEA